jgi:hypothetical protein
MRKTILVALGLLILVADSSAGMEWGLSAGASLFIQRQKEVGDIYHAAFPVGVQVWSGSKNVILSIGFEYLSATGQALPLDGGEEEFPLRLRVSSVPITLHYRFWIKDIFLMLGGGADYFRYEERWEDLDIVTEGKEWGPVISFLAGGRFGPRWSAFGGIRYEPMSTGRSSLLLEEVKLGGLKLTAGVVFLLDGL